MAGNEGRGRAAVRKAETSHKPVGAVISALDILRYLGDQNKAAGVTQIARDLGLNASTCYNILKTFVAEEIVIFDRETKSYALGLGLLDLAQPIIAANNDLRLIQPRLKQVATEFSVIVTLWRRTDNERMSLLAKVDSDATIRIHMSLGQRIPMWIGSIGRCMLAYSGLSEREFKSRFDVLRWGRVPHFRTFMREARDVRRLGYSIDEGNLVKGVTTMAVPVIVGEAMPQFCVGATMFSGQHSADGMRRLAAKLKEVAGVVSRMSIE